MHNCATLLQVAQRATMPAEEELGWEDDDHLLSNKEDGPEAQAVPEDDGKAASLAAEVEDVAPAAEAEDVAAAAAAPSSGKQHAYSKEGAVVPTAEQEIVAGSAGQGGGQTQQAAEHAAQPVTSQVDAGLEVQPAVGAHPHPEGSSAADKASNGGAQPDAEADQAADRPSTGGAGQQNSCLCRC